jgi:hypothetical protein
VLTNLNVTALLKSELTTHVDRLVKRADSNGDGHLSRTEFSEFLEDVVRQLELADHQKTDRSSGTDGGIDKTRE